MATLTKAVRRKSSEQRQADILVAALACFAEQGVARTTMAHICRRASASVGSVYHHFQSKEQLAAALYLQGITEVQAYSLGELRRHNQAEQGIRALVESYLTWVERRPDFARFLLSERHAEFMSLAEQALRAMNHDFRESVRAWLAAHVRDGMLRELAPEVYSALLVGPAEYVARQWLAGRLHGALPDAKRQLSDAAWAALSGDAA